MRVSVLLLTFNEQINLPGCLSSLSWCDDIVVLDSGSTDSTQDIAIKFGARFFNRPFDNFADQRNWALNNISFKHSWVLHLDADEVTTSDFVHAIESCLPPSNILAYQVPSKCMFFGRWLKYAGMWPSYQVRLGRVDSLRFVLVGHGQRENLPDRNVGVFPESYLHFSFSHGLLHWLTRHLRYADQEVKQLSKSSQGSGIQQDCGGGVTKTRRLIKAYVARLPLTLRPFLKFFYIYFFRFGFLDGRRGFCYAFMLSVYEAMIAVIAFETLSTIAPPETNIARSALTSGEAGDI